MQVSRLVVPALLTCILLYAALLRLDALFKSYGPYDEPRWLASIQRPVAAAASALTPGWPWARDPQPYVGGDPINYLKYVREMRTFYAAHERNLDLADDHAVNAHQRALNLHHPITYHRIPD